MQLFTLKKEMLTELNSLKKEGKSIGFVPTMGALHNGHIELVRRSKAENDITVVSIFVNPTQFDNQEDLKKYPRTLEADCELLKSVNCDYVFAPSAEEMYVNMPKLSFDFGNVEQIMEGQFRKGHFSGVGIVVSKLFHIVNPEKAYFGMKDLQQVAVIKRLVKDLDFNLEIIPCETIREKDGLAMSSRNRRLSNKGRETAFNVNHSLHLAKNALLSGGSIKEAKDLVNKHFENLEDFTLEYLEIIDFESFEIISEYEPKRSTAICTANFLEGVRLIDNIVF